MPELDILIPARNEQFLNNTIQSILENIRADTEIIVVLDGQWPVEPIPDHERVTMIYHPVSVGQRAACNEAARVSTAKYVMKLDAHCSVGEGFDVIMMEDMQPTWTMVPVMRNLHVFDWLCQECGHRQYQGPTPEKCPDCSGKMERDMVWIAKTNPQSTSYCFDPEPHFQYFRQFKKRPEGKGDLTETMSLQGSCWMMTREKYFELGVCDEAFGSWGSQGIEVSQRVWLSGGRVIVNHKTWYAHTFRTQGKDWSFPYHLSGKQVRHAKQMAKEVFFGNKWEKQIYPLSYVIERFWPIPGWTDADYEHLKADEMNVDRPGIYSIKNKTNGKVYIGSAISLSRRFSEHLRMLRRNDHDNPHLQNSWNKYGEEKFAFNIEYFCEKDDLITVEQGYIDRRTASIGQDNLYNISLIAGSQLGSKHTAETKAKMSCQQSGAKNGFYGRRHTPESIEKMRQSHKGQPAWNKGKPWSDEVKQKIGKANSGRVRTEETKRKISASLKGRKLSAEHKAKLAAASRGKGYPHTEEHKEKIGRGVRLAQQKNPRLRDASGRFIKMVSGSKADVPSDEALSKGILYYTDNRLAPEIMSAVQAQLLKAKLPIVSVSLKPIDFGQNIVLDAKRGPLTLFRQILAGLEVINTDVVYLAEHDCLYDPSHFDFTPEQDDLFYYNNNMWKVDIKTGRTLFHYSNHTSQLCAKRALLLEHYRKRVAVVEANGFSRRIGYEPGTNKRKERIDDYWHETWMSAVPNVDIRHSQNLTASRWKREEFRNQKYTKGWTESDSVPGWGALADFLPNLT